MSYNKLGFTSGQILKAEHLNHMEEGIANAAPMSYIIKLTEDNFAYMNYTNTYIDNYDEIYDVLTSGGIVWIDNSDYVAELSSSTYQFSLIVAWELTPNGLVLSATGYSDTLLCPNGSHNPS